MNLYSPFPSLAADVRTLARVIITAPAIYSIKEVPWISHYVVRQTIITVNNLKCMHPNCVLEFSSLVTVRKSSIWHSTASCQCML